MLVFSYCVTNMQQELFIQEAEQKHDICSNCYLPYYMIKVSYKIFINVGGTELDSVIRNISRPIQRNGNWTFSRLTNNELDLSKIDKSNQNCLRGNDSVATQIILKPILLQLLFPECTS